MMDAFSYLSVLISIILGLAIAQVLQGYRAILIADGRVRLHAPSLIWSVILLLFATQAWWASFSLREHAQWDFVTFGLILLQMVLLYMMAGIVLPEIGETGAADLGAHFARQRHAFFGFLAGMLVTSIVKDIVVNHSIPGAVDLAFRGMGIGIAVIGWIARNERAQLIIAIVTAIAFVGYIGTLFTHL